MRERENSSRLWFRKEAKKQRKRRSSGRKGKGTTEMWREGAAAGGKE